MIRPRSQPLRTLVRVTKRPKTRVQAIWTLADLGGLDEPSLLAGLEDSDPRVRESVIATASPLARESRTVMDALVRLADDGNARVRFQVALALGDCQEDRCGGPAHDWLVRRCANDPWMRAAILSSAVPHVDTLILALLRDKATLQGNRRRRRCSGRYSNLAVSQSNQAPID